MEGSVPYSGHDSAWRSNEGTDLKQVINIIRKLAALSLKFDMTGINTT